MIMTEELKFEIYGFEVKLYRDSEHPFNIIFEISRKGWSDHMIFEFFEKRIGDFREIDQKYLKLLTPEEWIRVHRFLLLLSSYLREDVKLDDWISIEPQKVEVFFEKPRPEPRNKVNGLIRFTLNWEEIIGRHMKLEEAKEFFMGLFKYPIMKEGLEAFMKLLGEMKTSNL